MNGMLQCVELLKVSMTEVCTCVHSFYVEWFIRARKRYMFTGIYHLRILLPSNYPLAPPDIMLLTPSGRFETHKKVCIDGITSAHQNSWRPIWGIRTAIVGLSGFWNLESKEATAGMGGLDYPPVEKKRLAKLSPAFKCPTCARSNQEILVEHEETVKAAEAAKTELGKELSLIHI